MKISSWLLIILITLGFCASVNAATISAGTCEQVDVQQAVDAASDGDIVFIPDGTCTWSRRVYIANKGITVMGAGEGVTVITDETPTTAYQEPFTIDTDAADSPVTIRDLTLETGSTSSSSNRLITVFGDAPDFRVTKVTFNIDKAVRGINISSGVFGLIDNITCNKNTTSSVQCISVYGEGDTSWETTQSFGDANAVYIEDSTFTYTGSKSDGAVDAYNGARLVFRYNTVNGTSIGFHGNDSGGYRSTQTYEIYSNNFSNETSYSIPWFVNLRGGTGVIYDNTVIGSYNGDIYIHNYRSCGSYAPWGICDGTNDTYDGNEADDSGTHDGSDNAHMLVDTSQLWTFNEWQTDYAVWNSTDGSVDNISTNTATTVSATLAGGTDNDWDIGDEYKITSGYPCQDQIGRTTDQELSPLYEWSNTRGGSDADITEYGTCNREDIHFVEGRDYYNDTVMPGYKPFPYPHPLVTGNSTPNPPSNLKVAP